MKKKIRQARAGLIAVLFVFLTGVVAKAESLPRNDGSAALPMDAFSTPVLNEAVNFWRQVFGVWHRDQVAFHDSEYLDLVYEVLDLPGEVDDTYTVAQRTYVERRRQALAWDLAELEQQVRDGLPLNSAQEALLARINTGAGRYALYGAGERLRSQRGMRERFLRGLEISGRYDVHIRAEFRRAGLPEDLAYLPHVESSFINHAQSEVGAVGIWQFMPETGRRFLAMNRAMDERYDPVLAAKGAARYLANAYDCLGDWALAITSYNHGVAGMARAKQQYGTDIERIVHFYRGRAFGFASRNFYAEFLAVRSIIQNLPRYFPEGVRFERPLQLERVRLTRPMTVAQLAEIYEIDRDLLATMNPAWTSSAIRGRVLLPYFSEVWLLKGATASTSASRDSHEPVLSERSESEGDEEEADIQMAKFAPPRLEDIRATAEYEALHQARPMHVKRSMRRLASSWSTRISKQKPALEKHRVGKRKERLHLVRKGESAHHIAAK